MGLAGLYCAVFGVVGLVKASGHGFFAVSNVHALGLRTNTAFATVSIIVGVAVLGATWIGRNIDQRVYLTAGPGFLVVGVAMLLLMRSSANFFNFQMSTCVVSFVIGLVLLASGLYVQAGHPEEARQEEGFRHGEQGDPHEHSTWGSDPTRTYEREPATRGV
jgi:hypothetical protein